MSPARADARRGAPEAIGRARIGDQLNQTPVTRAFILSSPSQNNSNSQHQLTPSHQSAGHLQPAMSRSDPKGKQRARDSDTSDQDHDPPSDSGHQRPSSTSQQAKKSKRTHSRGNGDEEEDSLTLEDRLDNEADWTPEEKARRERKTRADYRKLQLEIEGTSKRVQVGTGVGLVR